MKGMADASRESGGASASQSWLVEALELFMRRAPGSGPYMLDIRDEVERRWGRGAFMRLLWKLREMPR